MLFNSLAFLVFLPIVLIALALAPRHWRNPCLLVAGYFFYGCWDWRFLGLLALSTVIDFTAGLLMERSTSPRRRRVVVVSAISANLVILGFFKYFNFFVESFVALMQGLGLQVSAPTLHVVLPVGISFYTFQSMSYAIDVYRGAGAMPREELLRRVAGKSGLVCLLTDRIDGEVLDAGPDLRVVANVAVGFDNLDCAAARARGVVLTNTPDVLTEATADLAWGLILATMRRIAEGDRLVRVLPRWGVENWNWIEVAEGLAAGDRLAAQPGQIVGEGPFTAAKEQTDE